MYPPGLVKIDSYQRAGICHSHFCGGEHCSAYFLFVFSETQRSEDAVSMFCNVYRV